MRLSSLEALGKGKAREGRGERRRKGVRGIGCMAHRDWRMMFSRLDYEGALCGHVKGKEWKAENVNMRVNGSLLHLKSCPSLL